VPGGQISRYFGYHSSAPHRLDRPGAQQTEAVDPLLRGLFVAPWCQTSPAGLSCPAGGRSIWPWQRCRWPSPVPRPPVLRGAPAVETVLVQAVLGEVRGRSGTLIESFHELPCAPAAPARGSVGRPRGATASAGHGLSPPGRGAGTAHHRWARAAWPAVGSARVGRHRHARSDLLLAERGEWRVQWGHWRWVRPCVTDRLPGLPSAGVAE
jgi:hypothetical protein